MTRPKIMIVPRTAKIDDTYSVLYVAEPYRQAVIEYGGHPSLLLPPQNIDYVETKCSSVPELTEEEKKVLESDLETCDGIILPGGTKIFYYEYFIVKYAIQHNIPILGTCLGMQVMATCNKDNQLIKNETTINHDQPGVVNVHKVNLEKDSLLAQILETTDLSVNSRHAYHVENTGLYAACGYSEDGLIEAIEYKDNDFNIGVQWHPERTYKVDSNSQKLWMAFIKAAKNYQNNHK